MHFSIGSIIRSSTPQTRWMTARFTIGVAVFWSLLILVKIKFDPIHYQTIDGNYYQELARKLLEGKPFFLDGLTNEKGRSFSPYPPGFPLLLAGVRFLTGLPFAVCAVVLHGLLFAGLLWFFRHAGFNSLLILIAFSDTGLELAANCWSEFSFLVLTLAFGFALVASLKDTRNCDWMVLGFLAALCFLIRYSGVFILPFLVWKLAFASHSKTRTHLILTLILFGSMVGGWTLWQIQTTGLPTGGDRYPNSDSLLTLAVDFAKETINQLLIFKNPFGSGFGSFLAGLGTQLGLGIWLKYQISGNHPPTRNGLPFTQMGLFYLLFILVIRGHYYFAESFDFRLLGPGFLLVVMGLGSSLPDFKSENAQRRWLMVYIGLASLFFLPKGAILSFFHF